MLSPPEKLRLINYCLLQGLIGEEAKKIKCFKEFMVLPLPKRVSWMNISTRLEEAKKRDHRRLGRELDLFDIYEEGPGFPFFLPKGMVLRNILEDYWRKEHKKE